MVAEMMIQVPPMLYGKDSRDGMTVYSGNGEPICVADAISDPAAMKRGLQGIDALPFPGYGLMFFHPRPGQYEYWMYGVRFPLDIIWMDATHRIVEIVSNAQPCDNSEFCHSYGGHQVASLVLEIAALEVERLGLSAGDQLQW